MRLGEDVDLTWRALRTGARVVYDPSGEVIHAHRVDLIPFVRRRADYGSSEADLQNRHFEGRRTMVVSLSAICLLAALILLPVWWPASAGLGIGVMASTAWEATRKQREVAQYGETMTFWHIIAATLRARWAGFYYLGSNVMRYYSLPILAMGFFYPPVLAGLVTLLIGTVIVDYRRLQPGLPLLSYTLYYCLEMAAYQVGVWVGCIRYSSPQPFLPRIRLVA